jgi:hypothetical protein
MAAKEKEHLAIAPELNAENASFVTGEKRDYQFSTKFPHD